MVWVPAHQKLVMPAGRKWCVCVCVALMHQKGKGRLLLKGGSKGILGILQNPQRGSNHRKLRAQTHTAEPGRSLGLELGGPDSEMDC